MEHEFYKHERCFLVFTKNNPHEDWNLPQDTFEDIEVEKFEYLSSQITKENDCEEESPIIYHVGNIGKKYGEPAPFMLQEASFSMRSRPRP
jgi:hypothetical protein